MTVDFLMQEDYPMWDAFVAQHPLGLVYHLSLWKDALEHAFSHIKGHFLVLRDGSGKITAGIPVYEVRSWLLGNRIVSVPYASICDPLISSAEHYAQLLPELYALQKQTASRSIEIRTVKTANCMVPTGASAIKHLHHYLPLNMPSDELLKCFAYDNLRRVINRANKIGLQLKQENSSSAVRPFFHLLANTRKKHGLPPIPFKFIDSLAQFYNKNQIKILFATMGNNVIAGILILNFNGVSHVEYSGGNSQAYKSGASHFLHWEAIRMACDSGYKVFSFGRTDTWNEGLLSFKRRWATTEEPICTSLVSSNSQHLSPKYKSAKYSIASRWIFGHAPQFLRDALATFIYHHHG